MDLVEYMGSSTAVLVLLRLDDPADIVRSAAVSREWRRLVITNGLSKYLCLKICPEVSEFARVMEVNSSSEHIAEVVSSHSLERENPEREHRIYSGICNYLVSPLGKWNCILEAIGASSTDNYPYESIVYTLEPRGHVNAGTSCWSSRGQGPSYWSSKGQGNPQVPETLTYKLCSAVCIINEIQIQPFAAFLQYGSPVYSAQAVRFRTGYSRSTQQMPNMTHETGDVENAICRAVESYVWTYVSPTFTMWQINSLQSFKLPYPALAIGGLLQIELLGRVQKHEMDNLYYICVSRVRAIGRPLSPVLDNAMNDCSGSPSLEFLPAVIRKASQQQASQLSGGHSPNSSPDGSGPGPISLVGTLCFCE